MIEDDRIWKGNEQVIEYTKIIEASLTMTINTFVVSNEYMDSSHVV